MNSIRNGMNRKLRKHVLRYFPVTHGNAIGIAGKMNRQIGHVQRAFGYEASLLQKRGARLAQSLPHQVPGESVVTGFHRRVRGKNAATPHGFDIRFHGNRVPAQLELFFEQL